MGDVPPPNALYPQPAGASPSLMSDPAKVISLVGQLNQNALFNQTFNARKAIGSAYQDAIQPDGSIDTPTLMRSIKGNPDAAFMAGDASAGALDRQGKQISNATAELEQHAKQQGFLIDSLGTLADDPNPTIEKVRNVAVTWARNLKLPGSMVNSIIEGAPRDPRALHDWLTEKRNIAIGSSGTAERVTAPPGPGGAPQQTTKGAINYGPTVATGLSPAASAANTRSGEAYSTASEAAGNYANRVNPLRQAIPILENMKETDIGPISDKWNEIKSTAVNLGAGPLLGIDPQKIKDLNELKKYFNQYSVQAGATLGPHTNDGLAAAVTSNPNIHMDKLSATELSKVALGVERMRQAGVLEFNAKVDRGDSDPSQFNKFMTDWGTKQDPRAFVYDLMSKEQQEKLKKTLPPAELKKIREGMNIADRHGLLGDVHQ